MDHHFRAFSFVDRITSLEPGKQITGEYTIPPGIDHFPASLVAEAVGQLAAWCAMGSSNFERRPVAGIAGSIELLSPVQPGQVLELTAQVDTLDTDAVGYGGTARVSGNQVIRLENCVGPMMPLDEFDDPQALRDRFAVISGPGGTPGGFGGLPALLLNRTNGEAGRSARASFQVPAIAPLFADHFPRRPVFPGTLLMHMNLQLAAILGSELAPPPNTGRWVLGTLSDVKLRAFIPPGEALEIEAKLGAHDNNSARVSLETRNGKRVVGAARVLLVPEARP